MDNREELFKKIEKKTKVSKDTIISLAKKLQDGNMKNEDTIREVIDTLCGITGKNLDDSKKDKIVNTIIKDKVPKNVEKMF